MKKKLSILLAAAMATSMIPTGVFAATTNGVTSVPSAIVGSEWSLKEGNVDRAPQVTFTAKNRIQEGEQITLTLSGAEWAFYDVTDSNIHSSDGTDTSLVASGRTKKAPWIADSTASPLSVNASVGANTMAFRNLEAAAKAYPQSKINSETPDSDITKPDSGETTVTGYVYATGSTYQTTFDTKVTEYNGAKADYTLKLALYEEKKTEYENAKTKYESETDTTLKELYRRRMEEALDRLLEPTESLNTSTLKLNEKVTELNRAKEDLKNEIANKKAEIVSLKSKLDLAKAQADSAYDVYVNATSTNKSAAINQLKKYAEAYNLAAEEYSKAEFFIKTTKEYRYQKMNATNVSDTQITPKYIPGEYFEIPSNHDLTSDEFKATGAVKAVVQAVNFRDVVFEAANRISFRLNQTIEVNDKIAVPLLVKVYGNDPTVEVTSANGEFTTQTFKIAKVSSGSTVASISSPVSFADTANLYPIIISETSPGSFKNNDQFTNDIKLTLPSGFAWVATGTANGVTEIQTYTGVTYKNSKGLETSGWITSNNASINRGANLITQNYDKGLYKEDYNAGYAIIDPNDNGVLVIHLNTDSYNPDYGQNSRINLTGAKIKSKKATAKEGDVVVNITGRNFDSQKLTIAKYGSYNINLSIKDGKVPDRVAGRSYLKDKDNVKSATVLFEENVENSWYPERRTEFVVNKGNIRAVDLKVLDDVTKAGDGVSDNDTKRGISHSELVNGVTVTNTVEDLSGEKINEQTVNAESVASDNRKDYKRGYFKGGSRPDFNEYLYISSKEGSNRDFTRFVMNEFSVEDTLNNIVSGERKTRSKMELTFYVEVPTLSNGWNDTKDKDLTISLEGGAIADKDKQSLKIANIKEPITIEYAKTDVNLGYQKAQLGKVTITENFKEGFSPVFNSPDVKDWSDGNLEFMIKADDKLNDLSLKSIGLSGHKVANSPNNVKDGKVVGDILVTDNKILRPSTEVSKIILEPTIDLIRSIPEGKYDFKLHNVDEISTDITIPDYVNVITAAENKVTNYASDVKITVDGKTTVMKVADKEMTMDAPAFIKDDYTMLPLRDVAKALGIAETNITYNDKTGTATIGAFDKIIQARNGENTITINGGVVEIGTEVYTDPAIGRMYLPIGDLSRALGIAVEWDSKTNTATLNPSYKTGTPQDNQSGTIK